MRKANEAGATQRRRVSLHTDSLLLRGALLGVLEFILSPLPSSRSGEEGWAHGKRSLCQRPGEPGKCFSPASAFRRGAWCRAGAKGGCLAPLSGLASTARASPRLTGKTQNDVPVLQTGRAESRHPSGEGAKAGVTAPCAPPPSHREPRRLPAGHAQQVNERKRTPSRDGRKAETPAAATVPALLAGAGGRDGGAPAATGTDTRLSAPAAAARWLLSASLEPAA